MTRRYQPPLLPVLHVKNLYGTYKPNTIEKLFDRDYAASLAREYTAEAVARLAEIMRDDSLENTRYSLTASCALLDRGWGKAKEPQEKSDGKSASKVLMEVQFVDVIDSTAANKAREDVVQETQSDNPIHIDPHSNMTDNDYFTVTLNNDEFKKSG